MRKKNAHNYDSNRLKVVLRYNWSLSKNIWLINGFTTLEF